MVAEHREHWNFYGGPNIGNEFFCFFRKSVIGEITAKQEQISTARDLGKCVMQRSARVFAIMNIGGCGDPECALSHRL